jgi:hypothetical protein
MSEFEVIETQEQLDSVIGERIEQERETIEQKYNGYLSPEDAAKKYEGYLSPDEVEKKYKGYLSPEDAAEKDNKIKKYEISSLKMRIANEVGIPHEMADRLSGEDEDSIRKDAKKLLKLIGTTRKAPPLRTPERVDADTKRAALKNTLAGMKGE